MMYSESTLRRKAYGIGYQVLKGFMHCGKYVYHDSYGQRYSGYMIRDLQTGFFVCGCYNNIFDFVWKLRDVEDFLKDKYERLGYSW